MNRDDAGSLAHVKDAWWVWPLFLAAVWLLNEIVARLTERHIKRASSVGASAATLHPNQFLTRATVIAQVFTVALYAGATWYLNWPLAIGQWPTWLGFSEDAAIGPLLLAKSVVANSLLIVGPYLIGMVLSWIPRRRLASGSRRTQIPLRAYLSFEAKLTWLPFCVSILLAVLSDLAQFLPGHYTAWLETEPAQSLFMICMLVLASTVLMPLAAVKLWSCKPLPPGELKDRMEGLIARSGDKARSILVWGGRNTGMLNACVLGPWSRFRYVLISPMLAETLSLEETEAVLGHELGHAQYGHPTLYLAVYMCIVVLIGALYNLITNGVQVFPLVHVAVMMGLLISGIYFFFGAVSRQCEREADLASAELIGTPGPLITALEKIGERSGNSRSVPCWHHGSIADRVTALGHLSANHELSQRFHARLKIMRIGVIILAGILIAAQVIFHG